MKTVRSSETWPTGDAFPKRGYVWSNTFTELSGSNSNTTKLRFTFINLQEEVLRDISNH
jgi:hypothetical protein